jgi:hypothetical protein
LQVVYAGWCPIACILSWWLWRYYTRRQ